ncbi:hypothetical protein Gotur_008194, partial [Gossypium turneri]
MPPRYSFEIGSTSTAFKRLNIEEESNPETQTVDFRMARASTNKGEVKSRHPPLMEVQYLHKNTGIKENPLRMRAPDTGEQISSKDIKMIVEQKNYTNINLHTIRKQLDYIENLVESRKAPVKGIIEKSSKEPIFTPYEIPKTFQKSQNDFLTEIQNRLNALESYKSELIASDTPIQAQYSVNTLHQFSQSDSYQSDEQKINKMAWKEPKRLYYPKITAPDLNIEEKPIVQNKYNANTIYEWNIDGVSEYNILSLLQQMTMISNVYKTQNQNGLISDHAIANLLVAGFTGQLKGWWDHA